MTEGALVVLGLVAFADCDVGVRVVRGAEGFVDADFNELAVRVVVGVTAVEEDLAFLEL